MRTMVEMAASQVFDIGLPPRLRMLPARGRGDGCRERTRMGFRVSIGSSGIVKVELLHHVSEGELADAARVSPSPPRERRQRQPDGRENACRTGPTSEGSGHGI